jgi:DNA-binding transcriptional LysR family regulator
MVMLERLDPSNLIALHLLLEERHVTRAARRLGISQSSMSHRLARLRESLGDPLFVLEGARLVPTARALAMAEPLETALEALQAAIAPQATFDPGTSPFTIGVVMPDLLASLTPRIVAALTVAAPRAEVKFAHIGPNLSETLAATPASVALTPTRFVAPAILSRHLGDLRFGVVGRKGHPAFRRRLTTERWLSPGHVVVQVGNESTNLISHELQRQKLTRRVALEVPSFLAGLLVVASSDFLMNAPLPLVSEAARALQLEVREAPIRLPKIRFALSWHERYQRDPAHRWAREHVFEAARPMFEAAKG